MIEDAHESAIGHVTGTARYVDDIPCPADVCHVAIGLSTIANGEIKDIDLEEVRKSEGVLDVVVCEDIPGNPDNSKAPFLLTLSLAFLATSRAIAAWVIFSITVFAVDGF